MEHALETPKTAEQSRRDFMASLTPKKIVGELDNFIVGQTQAKRAVAIALRNRWRRLQLPDNMRDEVAPKNILMMGPTGVGKTEIARRLAKLSRSPFIKVEASKYTEVGYVGRDVESMVRDLVELTKRMVQEEMEQAVQEKAREYAEERLLDILLPPHPSHESPGSREFASDTLGKQQYEQTREKFRGYLHDGRFEDRVVEIEIEERSGPMMEVISPPGMEDMDSNIKDMLSNLMPKKIKHKKMKVPDALKVLIQKEAENLIDHDKVVQTAIDRAQQSGIIFIDEIDKITGGQSMQGPDVSREGVQRDLLPIVEGSSINTKYGIVKTDHMLFIAAGAFHASKPSDLIPEFQGRFPIRVELESLTEEDFYRILTEPDNALIKQYTALLGTEDVHLKFEDNAIREIARMSAHVNERTENIGARRLQTVMEKLLESISYDAPDMKNQKVEIDVTAVREKLKDIIENEDLSRYIL